MRLLVADSDLPDDLLTKLIKILYLNLKSVMHLPRLVTPQLHRSAKVDFGLI
jgi:hypothetical protein